MRTTAIWRTLAWVTKVAHDFVLRGDESIAQGVPRIAHEELDDALDHLLHQRGEDSVHEARKAIKRLRGLIRLVRAGLGEDTFHRENGALREAARRLAARREAAALKEAFDALVVRFGSDLDIARWHESEAGETCHDPASTDQGSLEEAAELLQAARDRVGSWPVLRGGWSAIHAGVRRVYAQGLDCFVRAQRSPSAENLHEWRKRVKYHWFHIRLLRSAWDGPMGALRAELERLGDLLGNDHDLSELQRLLLREREDPPVADSPLAHLLELIGRRRDELISEAYTVGARVYAERPRQLAARLGAYYRAWRADPASMEDRRLSG